ncbi:hypothetical protein J8995_18580 [Klebsiella quasipneumoniae subsp. quasipneumoniae]|uniref:hypothetical protein n=1 Tax=Klebsiella quasipneumoniae TaxID=1463165 RepID=UPI002F9666EF
MSNTTPPTKAIPAFDIHAKLKSLNECWSFAIRTQPHNHGYDFEFCTRFIPDLTFAIYKRIGDYFVLVDFFSSYDEACDEAKDILCIYPEVRDLILKATSIS